MRMSQLFGQTRREAPSEVAVHSYQLLLRAGLVRQHAAGLHSFLPLGWRVHRKVQRILRVEMDRIGGQELQLPVLARATSLHASGADDGGHRGQLPTECDDRSVQELHPASGHEETVTKLVRAVISSYRHLPRVVYHLQASLRDGPGSPGGLAGARECTAMTAYSFHADAADLNDFRQRMLAAYQRIFQRCAVSPVSVSRSGADRFAVLSEQGRETLVTCSGCAYAADAQTAAFVKPGGISEKELPIEAVATPGSSTIAELAAFLGVPANQTLKALLYTTGSNEVVMALIRGDLEASIAKLSSALGCAELRVASEEALLSAGLVPGYASPVGLPGIRVIADESIATGSNFVGGANREGFHFKNVNYPRDFAVDTITDIGQARAGDTCTQCGAALAVHRASELARLCRPETLNGETDGPTYLDRDGAAHPVVMGRYTICVDRLVAVIVEQNHDQRGIVWPDNVAPYHVHLLSLGPPSSEAAGAAEQLYHRLTSAGLEVLYDDREERAGVKFSDADLIGIPWRVVVSRRTLAKQGVEIKRRDEDAARTLETDELVAMLHTWFAEELPGPAPHTPERGQA